MNIKLISDDGDDLYSVVKKNDLLSEAKGFEIQRIIDVSFSSLWDFPVRSCVILNL